VDAKMIVIVPNAIMAAVTKLASFMPNLRNIDFDTCFNDIWAAGFRGCTVFFAVPGALIHRTFRIKRLASARLSPS
jgi:hypothetical protein